MSVFCFLTDIIQLMHAWVIPKMGVSVLKFCCQIVPHRAAGLSIRINIALRIWQNSAVVAAEGLDMETKRNITGDHKEEKEEDDEDELLKTRISSHPLYGRLVQNHLNCLKVGGIADDGSRNSKSNQRKADDYNNPCSSMLNQSELDRFMEAYCSALSKLKEAMEEPQQETIAFIKGMHSQLRELAITNPQSADVFLATEMNNSKWNREQQK